MPILDQYVNLRPICQCNANPEPICQSITNRRTKAALNLGTSVLQGPTEVSQRWTMIQREFIRNNVPLERQSLLPLCQSQTNVSIQCQSFTNLRPIYQSNANLKSICQFIINPSIRYRSWTNPAIHHQSITNPPIPRQTLTHLPICQSNELPIMDYSANPMQIPE